MIRSMTGFGTADGTVGSMRVSVELRSVNHRFFNPTIKLPTSLSRFEPEVRETLRRGIGRGHVTLTARVDETSAPENVIDESRFAAYVNRLRQLKQQYVLDGPIDLATVLRLPHVVAGEHEADSGNAAELVVIVDRALSAFARSRESEGQRLADFLGERLER